MKKKPFKEILRLSDEVVIEATKEQIEAVMPKLSNIEKEVIITSIPNGLTNFLNQLYNEKETK